MHCIKTNVIGYIYLQKVNEAAVRTFTQGTTEEDVNEAVQIVTDNIIPVLLALSKSSEEDDERTKQSICNTWVMIMDGPMDGTSWNFPLFYLMLYVLSIFCICRCYIGNARIILIIKNISCEFCTNVCHDIKLHSYYNFNSDSFRNTNVNH